MTRVDPFEDTIDFGRELIPRLRRDPVRRSDQAEHELANRLLRYWLGNLP